jgi:hypothetical protein
MRKFQRILLIWTLVLSACSVMPAAPQTVPPGTTEPPFPLPTTAIPNSKPISTVGTPHIDQGPDGAITAAPQNCGYQWAYQDLPELSLNFLQALQALQPEAQATAFAFGENCVLPDGSIDRFLPMETDFNSTLQVADLNNESDLGDWIVKVMQVISAIPPDQIVGPRPGRVSLTFQSNSEQKVVNFYINQYQDLPSGLSPTEIYQALQVPQ